jgi:methionyl-tRNA formyltransferase
MRIVFLGSPAFAVPSLEALIASPHEVVAVVTQPDRPSGRGHALRPPPVKEAAQAHGIRVLQPEKVSSEESLEVLRPLAPDVLVVAAYGQILRQRLLDLPARGSINVHASLLPRWRGASPIAASILAGDERSGVTIMEVVRALDAGAMIAKVEEPILPFDTTGALEERLSRAGARLLAETVTPWAEHRLQPQEQDEALVTYAPQLKREDARLDWTLPAVELWRRVRAFNPWPVAFTTLGGEELRVFESWALPGDSGAAAGTVLGLDALPAEAGSPEQGLIVQTGAGRLALLQIQRAGRRRTSGSEFSRGQQKLAGTRLG